MRFKSTTLTSYHNLKTKGTSPTCLPCRPFPLLPISRRLSGGSLKVNPRQELSDPPMLVRKVCVKPKDGKKQRTLQRGCGVSFTLPLSLSLVRFFPSFFGFPVWSRSVCYRKETVLFSLLLLSWCSHSPPPVFRSPSKRKQPGGLQMRAVCRSASIHFTDRCFCVCVRVCVLGVSSSWHRGAAVFGLYVVESVQSDDPNRWIISSFAADANSKGLASISSRFFF